MDLNHVITQMGCWQLPHEFFRLFTYAIQRSGLHDLCQDWTSIGLNDLAVLKLEMFYGNDLSQSLTWSTDTSGVLA